MKGWDRHIEAIIPNGPFEMPAFTDEAKIDLLGLGQFRSDGLYGSRDQMREWAGEFDMFQTPGADLPSSQAEERRQKCLAAIKEIVKKHGPFDCIMGFCQGATACIMALNEEQAGTSLGLHEVNGFIGIAPWICPEEDRLRKHERNHLKVPAFLCVGCDDHDLFKGAIKDVADMFPSHERHEFDGKHNIPSVKPPGALSKALEDFLDRLSAHSRVGQ
jgi:hypothetical protein